MNEMINFHWEGRQTLQMASFGCHLLSDHVLPRVIQRGSRPIEKSFGNEGFSGNVQRYFFMPFRSVEFHLLLEELVFVRSGEPSSFVSRDSPSCDLSFALLGLCKEPCHEICKSTGSAYTVGCTYFSSCINRSDVLVRRQI